MSLPEPYYDKGHGRMLSWHSPQTNERHDGVPVSAAKSSSPSSVGRSRDSYRAPNTWTNVNDGANSTPGGSATQPTLSLRISEHTDDSSEVPVRNAATRTENVTTLTETPGITSPPTSPSSADPATWLPTGVKPYYLDERSGIAIYHGDCREILPLIEPGSIDAVITDPPFFVRGDAWDRFDSEAAFCDFTADWMGASYKVAPVMVIFFADKFVPLLLEAAGRHAIPYRRGLIWQKPPGSQFAGASLDGFWYDFEMIQVFGEPRIKHRNASLFAVLDYRTVTGQEHGCEKPLPLLKVLMAQYAPTDGVVLDPFMGTGTTLRAAKDMGRRAIGIDAIERNCEVAKNRLRQEVLL